MGMRENPMRAAIRTIAEQEQAGIHDPEISKQLLAAWLLFFMQESDTQADQLAECAWLSAQAQAQRGTLALALVALEHRLN